MIQADSWSQRGAGDPPSPAHVAPRLFIDTPRTSTTDNIEPHWTKERLHELIESRLSGWKIIVVSNREPYMHRRTESGGVECISTAGGLTTALRPVLEAGGGTWIAHGAGDADREMSDERGCLMVPEEQPAYRLRRVWLTKEQERGYYYGLANEGLWPLCHIAYSRPHFREADWEHYREVNRLFADAVLEEAGDAPAFVFVQDYHFCLLPRMVKDAGRANIHIAQFWHIPWPGREMFRIFPWGEELLHGLTGNDLLGFHIRHHCQNFLDTADRYIEARVDREHWTITRGGRDTAVRPFPISIDFTAQAQRAEKIGKKKAAALWRERLGIAASVRIGAGIERMDFTKGIADRLRALDLFFENHADWRGRMSFIQIAAPSRSNLPAYQQAAQEVAALACAVNERWGTPEWRPVYLPVQHHSTADMAALHLAADFMVVNSLHDGMNFVAKEYCASRVDNGGVLDPEPLHRRAPRAEGIAGRESVRCA